MQTWLNGFSLDIDNVQIFGQRMLAVGNNGILKCMNCVLVNVHRMFESVMYQYFKRGGGQRFILRSWKSADRDVIEVRLSEKCAVDDDPRRLFTWGEGETKELSMEREKLSTLERVFLAPTRMMMMMPQG